MTLICTILTNIAQDLRKKWIDTNLTIHQTILNALLFFLSEPFEMYTIIIRKLLEILSILLWKDLINWPYNKYN